MTGDSRSGAPRRRRILFVGEAVTLAHVARPFVLARSLNPAEYEVHFACDPRFNKLLGPLPFPHHPIRTIPSQRFLDALARGSPVYDTQTLREYVAEDRRLFPDMTVKENLLLGAFLDRGRRLERDSLQRVFDLYPRLAERQEQLARTLSGGEVPRCPFPCPRWHASSATSSPTSCGAGAATRSC